MDNYTRKQQGLPYVCDEFCNNKMLENRKKLFEYNNSDCWSSEGLKRHSELLREILGSVGQNAVVLPPFRCDYGKNISVGDNFYANYNLIILDVAPVTIGNNVFIAPNVAIYTAGHPLHAKPRNAMLEYGIPMSIGDDVWIGGNAVICPGANIGSRSVIGAGSVVTRDVPEGVLAAGNPCRVIREITDDDMEYYFKKQKFDDEAMKIFSDK